MQWQSEITIGISAGSGTGRTMLNTAARMNLPGRVEREGVTTEVVAGKDRGKSQRRRPGMGVCLAGKRNIRDTTRARLGWARWREIGNESEAEGAESHMSWQRGEQASPPGLHTRRGHMGDRNPGMR